MKLGQVIKIYREENNISMEDFSKASGISKGYISMLEKDKNPQSGKPITPSIDMYENAAKGMNMSIESLISLTKGEDVDLVHDREEFTERLNKAVYGTFAYTFIPAKVSAGTSEDIEEAVYDCPKMNVPDAMLGKYAHDRSIVFMGGVNGESMNNIIENGAIIAVKTDVERGSLKDGDIVVASSNGSYAVKHFINDVENERIILRPDSTDKKFTDTVIPYENADSLKIFGKVVIYSVVL